MSFRDSFISALSVMVLVLLVSCEGLQLNRNKVTKEYVAGYRITDKHVSVDYSDSDNTTATAQVRVVDNHGKGVGGLGVQFKIACEMAAEEPEPIDEEPTDEEPTDEEPTDEEPTDEEPTDEEPSDEEPSDEESDEESGSGSDNDAGLEFVSHMSPPDPTIVNKCEEAAAMSDDENADNDEIVNDEIVEDKTQGGASEEECVEEKSDDKAVSYGAFFDFGGVVFTDEDGLAELTHQPLGDLSGLRCTIAVNLAHHVGDVVPEAKKEPAPEPEPTKEPKPEPTEEPKPEPTEEPKEEPKEEEPEESESEEESEEPKSDLS